MYQMLGSPGRIGALTLKNRLVMSPMGIGLADLDGTPSEEMIAYYEARAKGGAGIVIPEITRINDDHGVGLLRQLSVTKDRHIQPLGRLAEAVHRHGSKIIIQLHHPGRETMSSLIGGQPVVAPSAIPCGVSQQETRALETEEVKALVQQFIDGAVRVKKAGCDGVELHGAHGYLINQFLSPYTNKRTDDYGGSFENRMRFVTEIIRGIRAACGDFVLGVRLTVDEFLSATGVTEEYLKLEEGVRIAVELEKLGIDFIDVSCGIYETGITSVEPVSYPQGWRRDFIKAVKDKVGIPVIAVSVFREPEVAEAFLQDGVLDFVSMGRQWLADEDWGLKALGGRPEDIRKCISCLRCFQSLFDYNGQGQPAECAVNPRCARERKYGELVRDVSGKRAVVVGGGPAGLSAAYTLAQRGVDTVLLEKSGELGGQINLANKPPRKERMAWFNDFYARQVEKLGVDVRLNTEATEASILALNPDAVILATGSDPLVPDIPGAGGANVHTVREILEEAVSLTGKRVAVIGAGMTGLETADFLQEKGNSVTVVEMLGGVAPDSYKNNVLDVMRRLQKTEILLGHALREIGADGIVIEHLETAQTKTLPVDAVVLSLGMKPENALIEALRGKVEVIPAGDAIQAGTIAPAVRAGFEAARELFVEPPRSTSFCLSLPKLATFAQSSVMGDQEGVYLAYLTDPASLARILPPPLKPAAMPVVGLSVTHIRKPTFGYDYFETMLRVTATYEGRPGSYLVALLLDGPGAEMATYLGRDNCGMSKKLGASFQIQRFGDTVTATVARKGTQLINLRMELGEYNHPLFGLLSGFPAAGKSVQEPAFCFMFDMCPTREGGRGFGNARLVECMCDYRYNSWEPGHVSLAMHSSPDDPWGELPVVSVIGGAYSNNDLHLTGLKLLDEPAIGAVLPYLLTQMYDRTAFMETGERL